MNYFRATLAVLMIVLTLVCTRLASAQTAIGASSIGVNNIYTPIHTYINLPAQPLANFPSCTSANEGLLGRATTCASTTAGTTCSGAGSTHSSVICNGTNWIQMGY